MDYFDEETLIHFSCSIDINDLKALMQVYDYRKFDARLMSLMEFFPFVNKHCQQSHNFQTISYQSLNQMPSEYSNRQHSSACNPMFILSMLAKKKKIFNRLED